MAEFPAPEQGIVLTHLIVSDDVERSRRFYTDVLGGETVVEGEPSIVALANGWVIITSAAGRPRTSRQSRSRHLPTRTGRAASQHPRGRHPRGLR
jgi:catechol 2,3-dioxygenase-like lactoylglutathione lyase family enzyme